jgi:hypothetical protein
MISFAILEMILPLAAAAADLPAFFHIAPMRTL